MSNNPHDWPLLEYFNCIDQVNSNNHLFSATHCIVEQVYAAIVLLNLIPLAILTNHQRKIKKKTLCKNKKFLALLMMITFDLLIALSYTINWYKFQSVGKDIKTNMPFVLAIFKQVILFLVVYFTFRKASKADIKKQAWI